MMTGSTQGLPRFVAGQLLEDQLTADRLNQILDVLEGNFVGYGVGYRLVRGPGGVSFVVPTVKTAPAVPVDFQLKGGATISIYGGTVSDRTGAGCTLTPVGLTAGQYTDSGAGSGDTCAYLIVSYAESDPPSITSVTFDTDDSVPASESGTLNVPLGTFSYTAASGSTPANFTVTSGAIGSQAFAAWRDWFSNPPVYSAECNPV